MLKVVIADTWSESETVKIPDKFKGYFPKARFYTHTIGGPYTKKPHTHGFQVASRMLLPLIDTDVEVHLVRYLDRATTSGDNALFKLIKEIKPHVWNNSWTQPRLKNLDGAQKSAWSDWICAEAEMRKELGYILVFAAGNSDTNGLSYYDVGYPQRLIKDAIIVGAHNKQGIMAYFSSDGNVTCSALGHYVYTWNPETEKWEVSSGTSFSAPNTAGLIGYLISKDASFDYKKAIEWIKLKATIPVNYPVDKLPNPKFGWGSIAGEYMKVTKEKDAYNKVEMPKSTNNKSLVWMDFCKVE